MLCWLSGPRSSYSVLAYCHFFEVSTATWILFYIFCASFESLGGMHCLELLVLLDIWCLVAADLGVLFEVGLGQRLVTCQGRWFWAQLVLLSNSSISYLNLVWDLRQPVSTHASPWHCWVSRRAFQRTFGYFTPLLATYSSPSSISFHLISSYLCYSSAA